MHDVAQKRETTAITRVATFNGHKLPPQDVSGRKRNLYKPKVPKHQGLLLIEDIHTPCHLSVQKCRNNPTLCRFPTGDYIF